MENQLCSVSAQFLLQSQLYSYRGPRPKVQVSSFTTLKMVAAQCSVTNFTVMINLYDSRICQYLQKDLVSKTFRTIFLSYYWCTGIVLILLCYVTVLYWYLFINYQVKCFQVVDCKILFVTFYNKHIQSWIYKLQIYQCCKSKISWTTFLKLRALQK